MDLIQTQFNAFNFNYLLWIQINYNNMFIEALMQLPMSHCYLGVSKAILDGAGLQVEQELLQMGMLTICPVCTF